jgi:hypothetical protein
MIKVGDLYVNDLGTIVRIGRTWEKDTNKYIHLDRVVDDVWHGTWELGWFEKYFRPATKLDKLLAGL